GVKDVGDAKAGGSGHGGDLFEDDGEFGAGDDAILNDVVGGEASRGGESGFAALPDEVTFEFALCKAIFPCAILPADLSDLLHVEFDLGDRAMEFDEKESVAGGVVGMDGGFGSLD